MKAATFTYHDPTTVNELVELLDSLDDAKLLAGGQSLMPILNLRLAQPDHLIDLNTVEGLDTIETTPTGLRVGAMVRQATLMNHDIVTSRMPIISDALQWVGHFQTRTRGTIGGSLSHLDPTAELPAVTLLYDGQLTVEGPNGPRVVPMRDWPVSFLLPDLEEDELLTSIEYRHWDEPHGHAFEEFSRRSGDFAIVAMGALLAIEDGTIKRAAISIAGAQSTPSRLDDVEAALTGQPARADTFRAAAHMVAERETMADAFVSEAYRRRLSRVLTERVLSTAASRATEAGR
jgi:aerobic carbon-monoxide dehydrogenase medium subunit